MSIQALQLEQYLEEYGYMESYIVKYKETPCDPEVHVYSCEAMHEYHAMEQAQDSIGEHIIIVGVE